MGLAIALELRLRGCGVRVLSRDRREAAGYAAAGMLAPQAEKLTGPMLDLCLRSRALYPAWVAKLESLSGETVGYWPSGILCPAYQPPTADLTAARSDSQSHPQPNSESNSQAQWLNRAEMLARQPGLGAEVLGGWWFPQDGQVDNRRGLLRALQGAIAQVGVLWEEGVAVETLQTDSGGVTAVQTSRGSYRAKHYVLAAGAWSGRLLNLPVYPCKGQLLSLQPRGERSGSGPQSPALGQVLYGDRIYIVPRRDGLIVVGATVEEVQFTPGNTAAGVHRLLGEAMRLFPPLQDYELVETWWGYRPATPDELPILGPSPLSNLTLATGHHRNGVLLAPATAELIADWVLQSNENLLKVKSTSKSQETTAQREIKRDIKRKTDLHPAFRWDRFCKKNEQRASE